YGVGFVNDEHYLTPTCVVGEQGLVESMHHLCEVISGHIEAKFAAYQLQDIVQGELRIIEDIHHFEGLHIAVGERSVEQEGFPYPWLSQECHQGLARFETRNERLQSSRIPLTRKKQGEIGRIRERILMKTIKSKVHEYK